MHLIALESGEPRFYRDVERHAAKSTRFPKTRGNRFKYALSAEELGSADPLQPLQTWCRRARVTATWVYFACSKPAIVKVVWIYISLDEVMRQIQN